MPRLASAFGGSRKENSSNDQSAVFVVWRSEGVCGNIQRLGSGQWVENPVKHPGAPQKHNKASKRSARRILFPAPPEGRGQAGHAEKEDSWQAPEPGPNELLFSSLLARSFLFKKLPKRQVWSWQDSSPACMEKMGWQLAAASRLGRRPGQAAKIQAQTNALVANYRALFGLC